MGRMENNEIAWTTLCSQNSQCCPRVRVRLDGNVELRDDNGQTVVLTSEQYDLMTKTIDKTRSER